MAAEEKGGSPFVVLVSGPTPAEITYGPLLATLGDEGRTIPKNLEVCAGDAIPPDFDFDMEVEGIKRVADAAGEENVHLVGFSAGASACLAFAAKHPGRAASLALVEPPFIGNEDRTPEETAFWVTGDEAMALPPVERMGAFVRMLLRPGVAPLPPPPGPPPPWMANRPAALAALHRAFGEYDLDTDSLREYRNPAYFARGSLSNPVWEQIAERLGGILPNLEVEVYEERHHLDASHTAEPERFARALRKLWARAGKAPSGEAMRATAFPADEGAFSGVWRIETAGLPTETKESIMSDPEEILSYWFPPGHDADGETLHRRSMWWFRGGPEVGEEITRRFAPVLERAHRGELDFWADTPRGRLALIIVLDQFSRSVYRDTPMAYAGDSKALRLALEGIEAGMLHSLTDAERLFFTIPLGHSEDAAMHDLVVRLREEEVASAPPHLREWHEVVLYQATGHRDVIARFGRHPHRNEILGRPSTPEEIEYLREEVPVHRRELPGEASNGRVFEETPGHHRSGKEEAVLPEENKRIVRRVMEEVVNGGNLDVIEDLFAEDYVDHNLSSGGSHREKLKEHHAMIRAAFPDWHTAGEYMSAEGGRVVYRGTNSGTHRGEFMGMAPTGKRYSVEEIHIYRIAEGKVTEHRGLVAMMSMMKQLGLMPAPEGAEA